MPVLTAGWITAAACLWMLGPAGTRARHTQGHRFVEQLQQGLPSTRVLRGSMDLTDTSTGTGTDQGAESCVSPGRVGSARGAMRAGATGAKTVAMRTGRALVGRLGIWHLAMPLQPCRCSSIAQAHRQHWLIAALLLLLLLLLPFCIPAESSVVSSLLSHLIYALDMLTRRLCSCGPRMLLDVAWMTDPAPPILWCKKLLIAGVLGCCAGGNHHMSWAA